MKKWLCWFLMTMFDPDVRVSETIRNGTDISDY